METDRGNEASAILQDAMQPIMKKHLASPGRFMLPGHDPIKQ